MQETCGSVCAMVFWRASGTATPTCKSLQTKLATFALGRQMAESFAEKNSTVACKVLRGTDGVTDRLRSCRGCVIDCARIVEETLFPGKFAAYEGPEDESPISSKRPQLIAGAFFAQDIKSYWFGPSGEVGAFVKFLRSPWPQRRCGRRPPLLYTSLSLSAVRATMTLIKGCSPFRCCRWTPGKMASWAGINPASTAWPPLITAIATSGRRLGVWAASHLIDIQV